MFVDMVRGLSRVFCMSISIPAYNVLDVAVSTDVTEDFVDGLFLPMSRMCLVNQLSQFWFVGAYIGILFCLLRFLLMTASSLRRWCIRYMVYKDFF